MNKEQKSPTQYASAYPVGQIRVKRSVSPDGRINSLSVEILSPLESIDPDELVRRARQLIASEAKVIESFLGGDQEDTSSKPNHNGTDAVPARITAIGGMDTEWGRRLFLVFKVNGDAARVFGSSRKLAGVLGAAGVSLEEPELKEGLELDVPCRVVTGRTPDGRYLSIEKILPASS